MKIEMLNTMRQKITAAVVCIILYILLANSRSLDQQSFLQVVFGLKLIIPVVAGILAGSSVGVAVGIGGALISGLITGNILEWLAILGNPLMGFIAGRLDKRFMAPVSATALIPGYALHLILAGLLGVVPEGSLATSSFWWMFILRLLGNIFAVVISIRLYRMCFDYKEEIPTYRDKKKLVFVTNKQIWLVLAIVFAGLTAIFTVLFYFEDIFITFIVGAALILLTERIKNEYKNRMKLFEFSENRQKIYGYLLLTFWLVVTIILVWSSINQINDSVISAKRQGQDITATYITNLKPYVPELLSDSLSRENVVKAENYLWSLFSRFLTDVGMFIFNAVLIIPLLFFLYFRKRDDVLYWLYSHLPTHYHNSMMNAMKDMGGELHYFFSAKVVESLIIGVICALGFFVAGLKGWLLLGFLAGFLNIVPYIGPVIGAIPPVLLALLDSRVTALYVIITVVVAQLIDNFYLQTFMKAGA
ncbi:MAG: AI-2E family transporter, partial [Nanoarchaeota archaeon]